MLDHIFVSVSDPDRSIAFYTRALAPLGIVNRHDYDGKDGPPGHPDLKGFGAHGRIYAYGEGEGAGLAQKLAANSDASLPIAGIWAASMQLLASPAQAGNVIA